MQSAESYLSGVKCLHECCVCCYFVCVCVCVGPICFSVSSPIVCRLLATIYLPSHLMLQRIIRKIYQTALVFSALFFIFPPLRFRAFLFHCLDRKKNRKIMSTASDSLPDVPYLYACVWYYDRCTLTLISICVAHIVNGCNSYKWLPSAQHDCIV